MRSFSRPLLTGCAAFLAIFALAHAAQAQQQAKGFAVDRFYSSPSGAGWLVMDSLDMQGGLGAAASITGNYAYRPLTVKQPGGNRLAVVSDELLVDVGVAVTYSRFRFSLDMPNPMWVSGKAGKAGGYEFTGHGVDLGINPDVISDTRFGVDARVLGSPSSAFRLGISSQVFIPSGFREDHVTDDTYRFMERLLWAGDSGAYSYAGQLGVHVRPLNDSPTPGSPRGSEGLFGVAAGRKWPLGKSEHAFILGPEVYGQTAFRSFGGAETTGLEGLLTARLEGTGQEGRQIRVRLGGGGGIIPRFGTPEWRAVLSFEVFSRGGASAPGGASGH